MVAGGGSGIDRTPVTGPHLHSTAAGTRMAATGSGGSPLRRAHVPITSGIWHPGCSHRLQDKPDAFDLQLFTTVPEADRPGSRLHARRATYQRSDPNAALCACALRRVKCRGRRPLSWISRAAARPDNINTSGGLNVSAARARSVSITSVRAAVRPLSVRKRRAEPVRRVRRVIPAAAAAADRAIALDRASTTAASIAAGADPAASIAVFAAID